MPQRPADLQIASGEATSTRGDLEAGMQQPTPTTAQQGAGNDAATRPAPARSYSLGISMPSFLRTSTTQQPPSILPPPATAAGSNETASPQSPAQATVRRNRAHTVSVSLQPPRARAGSDAGRTGTPTGTQRTRRGSILGRGSQDRNSGERRRSLSRASRDGTPEPVQFDLQEGEEQRGLHDEVVGMLDCIDPHVSTVNHLQNMSNTLVFPHLPALWNRRPEVVLPHTPSDESIQPLTAAEEDRTANPTPPSTVRRRAGTTRSRASTVSRLFPPTAATPTSSAFPFPPPNTGSGFAPIPEGSPPVTPGLYTGPQPLASPNQIAEEIELEDDVEELEKDHDLDKHVRHVLTRKSKKEKAKRMLQGLWTYVKTPMGFVVAVYGFLVVFWGAAIVLFLLGWIPTNSKNTQDIWVEISSQVENGLFTVTGVGLIPWRAMDTYRMYVIWRLQRKVTTRRKAKGLEPIPDPNDIPDPAKQKDYVSVLSEYEQAHLQYQQEEFAKSQTWYKPHATATHKAFPISWALGNTLLMDGNSFFQCLLCGCMWGMNRHKRPAWTTGSLIPLSFLCGIGAAVLIWRGSVRTKKSVSVEEKLRSALGVSLAISGVPQTKDGTIITGDNRAPTPPTPGSSRSTSGETDEKRPYGEVKEITADEARGGEAGDAGRGGKRRTTITIGSIPEKQDSGRNRASTVAAPGPLPRRTLQPLGPAMPTNAQEDEVSAAGGMELREIASQPRVAEAHQP